LPVKKAKLSKLVKSEQKTVHLSAPLILDVPLCEFEVTQWQDAKPQQKKDWLAEETPVALIYNGVSHAVMLATALDLEDFALGFSMSEGIIESPSELYGVEVQPQQNGIALQCEISSERFAQLKQRRRTLAGKTGCGLCGAESLEHAVRYPQPIESVCVFAAASITLGLQVIQSRQQLQQKTGATHACAYILADGAVLELREDVGRHNALDKLVGALAKRKAQYGLPDGFIITTSRASFEMVQKTASAGIAVLVAVSAPTGLAVRVAQACGLTLIGFARKDRYVVYSHPYRVSNM